MTSTLSSPGTPQPIETSNQIDSIYQEAILLGDGSAVVAMVIDLATPRKYYVTIIEQGGATRDVPINMSSTTKNVDVSLVAVGANHFAIVTDDENEATPFDAPFMQLYDFSGAKVGAEIALPQKRYFDTLGLGDGNFVVRWYDDSQQKQVYTRYDANGVAVAGQNAVVLPTSTNAVEGSFGADASGGFLYATVSTTSSLDGVTLRYVSASGTVSEIGHVAAGAPGPIVFDGVNFRMFHYPAGPNSAARPVSMSTISLDGTISAPVPISGLTSQFNITATAMADGSFIVGAAAANTGEVPKYLWIDGSGAVLSSYDRSGPGAYPIVVATPDGALVIDNYPVNGGQYDANVAAWNTTFLDSNTAPQVATPATINLADTVQDDAFAIVKGSLSATDDVAVKSYGIEGGGVSQQQNHDGLSGYNIQKVGSYGTLYLRSSDGKYVYKPDGAAINALTGAATDQFTVSAIDDASAKGTAILTVSISAVNDTPLVVALDGYQGVFIPGSSDPVADEAFIGPAEALFIDGDFHAGFLVITQTDGDPDGYFVGDADTYVLAGPDATTTDGRFDAGDKVFVDLGGNGGSGSTSFDEIGTVTSLANGGLRIDFNSSATAQHLTRLLQQITYTAPTAGARSFTLVVDDGRGLSSTPASFTMTGSDNDPPLVSVFNPGQAAASVSALVSPQISFNEAVKFGAGKIFLVDTANNTVIEEFDVATDLGGADGQLAITGGVLTINPSASLQPSTTYAIRIEAGAVTDLADNPFAGIAGSNYSFTTSAPPPTVAITADATSLKAGQKTLVRFDFSSAPANFEAGDVQVSGGSLGPLTLDPNDATLYIAQFTPSEGQQSLHAAISIGAGAFQDSANLDNLASNVLQISGDTGYPRISEIVRVAPAAALTNGDSLTYRVGFSEAVTLTAADFSVSGSTAAVTQVVAGAGNSYLVTVAGGDLAGANGVVTLGIASGHAIRDSAGNLLQSAAPLGANEASYTLDNFIAPASLALAADTGVSAADGVTSAPAINVTLANEATGWEYSINAGADWIVGAGASFNLPAGSYAAGAVRVRQHDALGNVSAPATNGAAIVIDTTALTVGTVERDTLRSPAANASFTIKVTYADAAGAGFDSSSASVGDIVVTRDAGGSRLEVVDAVLDAVTGIATYTIAAPAGGWAAAAHAGAWSISLAGSHVTDLAGNALAASADTTSFEVAFTSAPVITSNGGGADAIVKLAERTTAVTTVAASGDDNGQLVYSIDGGADGALFTIDAASGVLRFLSAPNHATPGDAGADNTYEVRVKVADADGGVDLQTLSVQVLADLDGDGSADIDDSDIDGDGRPNTIEDAVAGALGVTGDGNGDGIADSSQLNVASLPTVVAGAPYVTLAVAPGLSLTPVSSGPAPAGLPRNVKMPLGELDFTIGKLAPGATVEMSIYVDAALKVNSYFKQDNSGKWANIAKSVETVGGKTKITFSLTDGGIYDSDGLVNGSIRDPGGVALITPLITSNEGGEQASVSVRENTSAVTTVAASAAGAVAYSISGGADAALFRIDPLTGALRFAAAPDYEQPRDLGDGAANNSYVVEVTASDATGSSSQLLTVRVTDVDETPAPTTPTTPPRPPLTNGSVDGVPVQTGTVANADGSTSATIIVPVVTPGRQEQVGNNTVADIPLFSAGGKPLLSAQVPTGYGLQVSGSTAPKAAGASLTDLIREIKAHTTAGSQDQDSMVGGGSGFLSDLAADTPLLVHTVVPTVATSGVTGAEPLVIAGVPRAADGPMSALVIDSRGLPAGTQIKLDNVDFAALIGAVNVSGGAGSQKVWGDGASQTIFLGADDDVLHGGAGDDIVGSAGGNDRIYGDEGNDLVFGGEGDDYVDGGSGMDTVLLAGLGRADYSIRIDGGNVMMTHLNGGIDGRDTVANVETLRFAGNADVAVGSTDLGGLVRMYQGLFGRDADQGGINFWLGHSESGLSMRAIASYFVASSEAAATHGAMSNAQFVDMLYRVGLERSAEANGFAFWTARLDEGVARGDVLLAFAESNEMAQLVGVISTTIGLVE